MRLHCNDKKIVAKATNYERRILQNEILFLLEKRVRIMENMSTIEKNQD